MVTSLCFGGADRRDLYIVTGDNTADPDRARHDLPNPRRRRRVRRRHRQGLRPTRRDHEPGRLSTAIGVMPSAAGNSKRRTWL